MHPFKRKVFHSQFTLCYKQISNAQHYESYRKMWFRTFSIQILWIYLGFFPHIVLTWSWTHVPTIPLVQANWNLLTTSLLSIYEGCRGWVHFFKYHSIIMLCFCHWWYCCLASIYYFNSIHMNIFISPFRILQSFFLNSFGSNNTTNIFFSECHFKFQCILVYTYF